MQPDEIVTPELLADLDNFAPEQPKAAFADHIVSYYGPVLRDIGFDVSKLTLPEIYMMASAVIFSEIVERRGGWVEGNDIELNPQELNALQVIANAAREKKPSPFTRGPRKAK